MKLEVGMYVRTKRDGIGKILSFELQDEEDYCFIELPHRRTGIKFFNIVEASHNIIDLIEVGDYVNGMPVMRIYEKGNLYKGSLSYRFKEKTIEVENDNYETIPYYALYTNEEIETIVTKEQFESMNYKVVEE